MPVPAYIVAGRKLRRLIGPVLLFLMAGAPTFARGPGPPTRIPLEPLGFQSLPSEFLLDGSSMLTLHYVDDEHLLVTFNVRRLMKRLPEDPPDDRDRNVDALLLELPSGRILARTNWRTHDHGQYLWGLGNGRFLLRVRDTLTTFAPLANLASGEPFRERPFINTSGRHVGDIILSPDSDMIIVESKRRTPPVAKSQTPLFGPATVPAADSVDTADPAPVQLNFYRLSTSFGSGEDVQIRSAGVAHAKSFGGIVAIASGYLAIIDQGHRSWAFDFDYYSGKVKELSPFDSTCRPLPAFVNQSEFISFGCRNGLTMQVLGGFNMRGEEMWQQNLFGDYVAPSLAFATSSGRFVLSRVLSRVPVNAGDAISSESVSSQSIMVYQAESGAQILHAECSPIQRSGQNFALSPDGLSLAVIHAGAIEIFGLPPLTSKEQTALKLAQASAPEESEVPVHFSAQAPTPTEDHVTPAPDPATLAPPVVSAASPAPPPPQPSPVESEIVSGDPTSEQPRKPPTLYTLPTDPQHSSTDNQPK
jgi:hypothetical protein